MKYGLKAVLRTPLKTVLFALLLIAVTAFLSLGVGMWRAAEDMLDEADTVFKTAGEFIFTGGNYPDDSLMDNDLLNVWSEFDSRVLERSEVLTAEENLLMRAYLPGFTTRRADMPYGDCVVMIVSANYRNDVYGVYNVITEDTLYLSGGYTGKGLLMYEPEGMSLEKGHNYIVVGRLVTVVGHNYSGLKPVSFEELGFSDAPYPSVIDIGSLGDLDAFWESGAGEFYRNVLDTFEIVNSSVDVLATGDAGAVSEFHRGEYTLIDGSLFETGESDTVCVIPKRIALRFDLAVGDEIELSVMPETSGAGRYSGYDPRSGFTDVRKYTIAGIYDAEKYTTPIYIPATGQAWLYHSDADYTLARVVLRSRDAASYIASLEGMRYPGINFEVYDQGYAAAVRPILSVRATALFITGLCALAGLLILWFFGFFFVYRSRETARILLILGTKAGGIVRFFLTGSGVVTMAAAAIGATGGYFAMERVFQAVFAAAEKATGRDIRFSVGGYGIRSDAYTPIFQTSPVWFVLIALCVLIAALAICLVFAALLIRAQNPRVLFRRREKRGKKHDKGATPKRPAGAHLSAVLPAVSLRYAVRSILRGGKRSLIVPGLFAAFLLFLAVFAVVQSGYQEKLDTVYEDIPVTLRVTDISGRKLDNLIFYDKDLNEMKETGFLSDVWSSANYRSEAPVQAVINNWRDDAPLSSVYKGGEMTAFQLETFLNQMKYTTDAFIVTDRIDHAPEFFYTGLPPAEFLEGLDWDYFMAPGVLVDEAEWTDEDWDEYYNGKPYKEDYILISRAYANAYNLSPGDDIRLNVHSAGLISSWEYTCRVGGIFDPGNNHRTVYAFHPWFTTYTQDEVISVFHIGSNTVAYLDNDENGDRWVYLTDSVTGEPNKWSMVGDEEDEAAFLDRYTNWLKQGWYQDIEYYSYKRGLNAGGAVLTNTNRLSDFKDWLSERYDQIGSGGINRRWVLIDDDALYSTIENLTRYIGFMDLLYPVIFALVAAIGFLISNLLLKSRAAEIGLLRGIGTSRGSIFLALLIEQCLLSLPGLVFGIALPMLMFGGMKAEYLQNAGLFAACYFAGVILAILHTFRDKAIKNLARRAE